MGLVDIINQLIPSKMDAEPGIIFLGMVMDTLSGRTPLYRLVEFFQGHDTELLLGKRISSDKFCDYNVVRVLIAIGHYLSASIKFVNNCLQFLNLIYLVFAGTTIIFYTQKNYPQKKMRLIIF